MPDALNAYDAVPYPSAPYWFSHPSNLAVLGRLFGLHPPPVETARVLELGCASGRNLLPMAASLPDARVVGVESSAVQVAAARALAEEAGLENVVVREQGLEALSEEDGRFEYIVAHGVYSWVDPATRLAMLRVCRERLAEGGVVYASYNTLPGWSLPLIVRRMLMFATAGEAPTAEREGRALAVLEAMAAATAADGGALAGLYAAEAARLRGQRSGYLTHEHLEPENHPVYFETFLAEARAHGLDFVSSAARERMDPSVWPEVLRERLAGEPDPARRQQLVDFVANTRFRADLLAPVGAPVTGEPEPGALAELYARCELPREAIDVLDPEQPDPVVLSTPVGREERVVDGALKAALVTLVGAAPAAVPVAELLELGEASGLARALLRLYLAELVELSAFAPRVATSVSERPRVGTLARAEARLGAWATNRWHQPVQLGGLERWLVPRLDGTRDRVQLAVELGAAFGAGEIAPDEVPGERRLELALEVLMRAALLEG